MNSDTDGFTLVKSKKNRSSKPKNYSQHSSLQTNGHTDEVDIETRADQFEKNLLDYKNRLENFDNSQYWFKLKRSLKEFLPISVGTIKIKSYGLGSIENNINSRYQFVLLLLIIDELKQCDQVEFFDPIFTSLDKFLITKKFNFKVSDKNDEAKCGIAGSPTLFYMPHCGKALYNNLLFSNWSRDGLDNLYLIGNSFRTIRSLNDETIMTTTYPYINVSEQCIEEIRLNDNCEYTNAFNDMTLIKFNINQTGFEFVYFGEPKYDDAYGEIIFDK